MAERIWSDKSLINHSPVKELPNNEQPRAVEKEKNTLCKLQKLSKEKHLSLPVAQVLSDQQS